MELWDLTTATLLFSAYDGVDEFIWDAHPVSDDEVWVWIEAEGVPTLSLSQDLDLAILASGLFPDDQPLWFSVVTTSFPASEPPPDILPLFLVDLTADASATVEPTTQTGLEPTTAEVTTVKETTTTTETSVQTDTYLYTSPQPYTRPQPPFRSTWQPPFIGRTPPPKPSPSSPPPSPTEYRQQLVLLFGTRCPNALGGLGFRLTLLPR